MNCLSKDCPNKARDHRGLCYNCLGYKKKCEECGKHQAWKDGLCIGCHPDGKCTECETNQAQKDGFCRECLPDQTQRGDRCKICKHIQGSKRFVKATNAYVFCCIRCFYHTYPNEKIPTRYKAKQHYVNDALNEEFGSDFFVYDKPINEGCSKHKPDWLRDCLTHSVIIECDEDQHKQKEYSKCDIRRINELYSSLADRPIVLIRFNPDKYKDKDGKILRGVFKFDKDKDKIHCFKKDFAERFKSLVTTIKTSIENVPSEPLTEIVLYYDI